MALMSVLNLFNLILKFDIWLLPENICKDALIIIRELFYVFIPKHCYLWMKTFLFNVYLYNLLGIRSKKLIKEYYEIFNIKLIKKY